MHPIENQSREIHLNEYSKNSKQTVCSMCFWMKDPISANPSHVLL